MDLGHRIGTAERDEAVRRLQEHVAAGRLEMDEFETRMATALAAKTRGDLVDIFSDLPDEDWMIQEAVPQRAAGSGAVQPVAPLGEVAVARQRSASAYAWTPFVPLLVFAVIFFGFRLWALMPIFIFGLVMFTGGRRGRGQGELARTITYDASDLTDEIRAYLQANRKIEAIKIYRERTGVGLAEAKDAVEAIGRRELGA